MPIRTGALCSFVPGLRSCFPRKKATKYVTVEYSKGDRDRLLLCGECTALLKADAEPRGYTVVVEDSR